jgi:putative DNA primase/helicase
MTKRKTKKFANLLEKYQGNAYPAMYKHLAQHLGVSAESLQQLALGWAPIVQFKKGPSYQGWWVIPERDELGLPVGLSLRSQGDFKCTYPGSKRGLTYAVNPNHEQGCQSYRPGPHNWVRTADAGIDCPICGKPDGCVVSCEDPADPKAVICIRVQDGATKPMRFGYLHIRKEEGRIQRGASALPPSEHPVIIVEGMTDVAAAMDLGFVAVGRPSNLAGMKPLGDLVRGRSVLIIGENDGFNESTGQRPGHEGMIACFQVLKKVAPEIRMVLPPEHVKDLRQWIRRCDITGEELLEYAEAHGRTQTEQTVLPDAKPLTIATAWLDSNHRMAGRYTLRYHLGQWFQYTGRKYEEVDPKTEIRGSLYGWCDDKQVVTEARNGEQNIDPIICTRGTVNNIMDALLHPCPIGAEEAPAWINGATGPDPVDLIAFSNGILHVPSYLQGKDEAEYFLELTPDFFTTFALPFEFDPLAQCPTWKRYLRTTLGDEAAKIRLLREWFGYCLVPDTRLHKMMLFRGPRRSGKGVAATVLQEIVGRDQSAAVTFGQLTQTFGLAPLVGKHVAIIGDAQLPRTRDAMQALEMLLNIVGEDPVNVERKFLESLPNHRLKTRITMAANELPELPDHAGAMEARLNIIDFQESFVGREDFDLRDKLIAEAPGIALWALRGLQHLRTNGRFTLPESSKESLREWRRTTSPMAAFLEECCTERADTEVQKQLLYDAWTGWAAERGIRPISKGRFAERVKANAPFARAVTYEKGGHKFSVYRGLELKAWAAKQFCGKPD